LLWVFGERGEYWIELKNGNNQQVAEAIVARGQCTDSAVDARFDRVQWGMQGIARTKPIRPLAVQGRTTFAIARMARFP
jgi:hypothetical protein